MAKKVDRGEAYRRLSKLAEKGKTPRIWMGADSYSNFHLGHVSTMLYGFSMAAPLAKETPVDFILALNDVEVDRAGIRSFTELADAMAGYLNSRFDPPAETPIRIRLLRESEMISEPEFREDFGRLIKGTECYPICPEGHSSMWDCTPIRDGRHRAYECSCCANEGRESRYIFDARDPGQMFLLDDVMLVRDRYLAPGVHVVGDDRRPFLQTLERSSPRLKVGVLVAPELKDAWGHKMSKSLGNGAVPDVLDYSALDRLHEFLLTEPEKVSYKDWSGIFGDLGEGAPEKDSSYRGWAYGTGGSSGSLSDRWLPD